ncbi:MAG: histidinol-phosphatase HisJ family protein [Oscillospiraceae bacterium]|nr:histidinol-phosphatase HisJ family protein [Oscillospiraceae bacterium]
MFDTHTHTTISDGANSPEEMLERAEDAGFRFLAITDHFDIHDDFPVSRSMFDRAGTEEAYRRLTDLKHRRSPECKTDFLKGIEIGQAHQHKEIAENWLDSHNYDFVIASCHIIRKHIDFYHMDYEKNPPDIVLEQYFAELIELCSWCGNNKRFDSLAHLLYPLRYMGGEGDITKHKAAIDELFRLMLKYEIALEINTAKIDVCTELPQVRRYYELGGRLITIGSDSHSVDTIAQGINQGIEVAKAAGFTECAYYKDRGLHFMKF